MLGSLGTVRRRAGTVSHRCGTLPGVRLLTSPLTTVIAAGATCAIIVIATAAWMVAPPVEGPMRWAVFGTAAYWAARTGYLQLCRRRAKDSTGSFRTDC